ncbi:MAG TPA: oxalate/formate MFS antiporter [Oxalicibacterium sp.]|nr:oxalate/formate MFS antiporter [Oxalicibacterium sp.]
MKTIQPDMPVTGIKSRWWQLIIGIICMAMVANLQYGWTLFVGPINAAHPEWTKAAIQATFAMFIITETWLVPFEGMVVDKFGPRPVVAVGAILVAISWILNSQATSLDAFYIAAVCGGIGAGCVYGTCVGNALKWFPDKRGLAAGLTAAGFGAGAALTIIPISNMIRADGYQAAFHFFGILQGVVVFILAMTLVRPVPPAGIKIQARQTMAKFNMSTGQMLKTPVFWLIYVLFVAVAMGGVMATAQLKPIGNDWGLSKEMVTIFGTTLPALTMALSIDSLCNGFTRPLCGFVSDRLGRENTMFIVFTGEALALLGLYHFGHSVTGFMIFAALIFACWGEIFSIFPAIAADTFGSKNATGNAGMLYTAKGTASLVVPWASWMASGGSSNAKVLSADHWGTVFYFAAAVSFGAALLAKFFLQNYRKKFIEQGNAQFTATEAEVAGNRVAA